MPDDSFDEMYKLGLCDNVLRCGRWQLVPRHLGPKVPCPHCRASIQHFTRVTADQVRQLLVDSVHDVMREG